MARSKKTPRIGEIQYERIFDWSGGMNNAVNPVLLKDNESPLLENASLDEKGTLFPRMGSRDRYSEQIGNEPVTGIGTYYKSDGTSRLLISAGTKLYEDNPHIMDIFENQDEFEQGTIAGSASITKKPNSVVNKEDPEDVELKIDTEEEWDTGEKDNIVVNPDGTISLAKVGEDIEHKDETEEDFDAGTFDNVEFISGDGEDVALTESGEDFEEGELDGVVVGEEGLELEEEYGDTFTKLSDPGSLPTGAGYGAAFSPDGIYLAVAHSTSPYITIYKRSGDTFTKLSNPGSLPTSIGRGAAFSPDGIYLAVAHNNSPYITIYKRSGDTFTKLNNPGSLPTGIGWGAAFSPDGIYLAVAHDTSPYITIYKRSGDTFTKLNDPGSLPTGTGYGAAFSPDGIYLAVAHSTSPFITIYKRSLIFFESGSRTSLPLDLSSVGTVKTSEISWQATEPTDTSLKVETSLSTDGGETWGAWQQATNGGSIPGIVPDMDLSNAKLKTRATLETEDTRVTPILHSLSILLIAQKGLMLIFDPLGEQYAASGTWTSPVIDLTALVAEANSLITWDDEVPEDTNLTIEAQVSVDGETWGEYQALTKNNPLPAWEGYIRYRITLTSNVTRSKTPVIESVSMNFVSQYVTEGVWIGPPMDLRGIIVGDTAATFSKDTPEGTGVVLYVGKGKSEEHVGEWEEIAQNGDPFDHDWFVRPKIVLTSDDGMVTPKVNSVTLNASQNGARGFWMTPVIDATAAIDKSSGRVHLESVSNAGAVTARSRSSEDGKSWSEWVAADADGKLNHSPDNYVQVAVEITADAELVRLTIYFDGTSSATIISDNYFPGGQFYFATLLDWLIIVNGIDPPRKYNGGIFQDNEVKAKLTTDLEGENNDLVYTSKLHGALGNDITIEYHDPEEAEQELSIDITLYAIKINLATDENGAITTTAEDIKNAIEEHDDAKEIVEVNYAPENDGSGVVTAMAATPLSGGITSAIVGGDPPYAHYVAAHKNRLWLASGSRLYFSEILNFEEWPALNFIDISPNDGDVITGLLTYGDYLIITKGHSLWMLTGDGFETFAVRRIHADRGAYAPRSLITVNDLVSFVSDDGIYFTDFTQAVLISERIKPFWQTLNARRFNQAASWFYDHKLYVALPSANSMINDVVIVYDVLRQTFVGIYKGWKASCWAAFREGGRVYSYYGHSDKTMVTQIATGYSDNDKPYVMVWRSKEFDFNTPEIYKRFNLMLFQVSPAVVEAEITVRFYVDGAYIGEIDVPIPQGIGNMIHNIRVLASRAGVVGGHRIALEVAQEVLNNPVGIQLISLEYVAHGIKPTIFR